MTPETTPDTGASAPVRPISKAALVFYGICRFISVGASRLYFPGPVIGAQRLPRSGPYVLAPIHRSYVDWLVAARVTRRRLRYIVKGEVWSVPAVGRFIELLGAFPVRRGAPDREAFHRALEVLVAGEPLVIFPEGTRNSGPLVGELREGAAYLALRAHVPIVPVGIAGTERAMSRGSRFPRPARVRIVVGEPIVRDVPSAEGRAARVSRSATRSLSEELRGALQEVLADAESLLEARRLALPRRVEHATPRLGSSLASDAATKSGDTAANDESLGAPSDGHTND